jgi:hypothetical protein
MQAAHRRVMRRAQRQVRAPDLRAPSSQRFRMQWAPRRLPHAVSSGPDT